MTVVVAAEAINPSKRGKKERRKFQIRIEKSHDEPDVRETYTCIESVGFWRCALFLIVLWEWQDRYALPGFGVLNLESAAGSYIIPGEDSFFG